MPIPQHLGLSLEVEGITVVCPGFRSNTRSTNSSAIALIPLQTFAGMLHIKHLQNFVAIMVDNLDGDFAAGGFREGSADGTIKT